MKLTIPPKSLAWLPALLASLLLALAVGLMMFVIMGRRYGEDFDAVVQEGVDAEVAAMMSVPHGAPPATVTAASVGGREREVHVVFDPVRVAQRGITIDGLGGDRRISWVCNRPVTTTRLSNSTLSQCLASSSSSVLLSTTRS